MSSQTQNLRVRRDLSHHRVEFRHCGLSKTTRDFIGASHGREHESAKHTAKTLFTTQHDKEIVGNVHFRGTQEILRESLKTLLRRREIQPKEPLADFL